MGHPLSIRLRKRDVVEENLISTLKESRSKEVRVGLFFRSFGGEPRLSKTVGRFMCVSRSSGPGPCERDKPIRKRKSYLRGRGER